MTGVGFYTRLELTPGLPPATMAAPGPVGGGQAEIHGLEHGAGFLIWLKEGRLSSIEGFSYEEPWPARVDEFKLV